jgi:hypothetical protein
MEQELDLKKAHAEYNLCWHVGFFLLQIRDYKRSGKAGSATIKGREEMKGAPNRLTAM